MSDADRTALETEKAKLISERDTALTQIKVCDSFIHGLGTGFDLLFSGYDWSNRQDEGEYEESVPEKRKNLLFR